MTGQTFLQLDTVTGACAPVARCLPARVSTTAFVTFPHKDRSMIDMMKGRLAAGLLLSTFALTGCVSKSSYDAAQAQNQQLQQQNATLSQQLADANAAVDRLQGAIKYTVNSDLLFASGSFEMTPRGQQIIAGF